MRIEVKRLDPAKLPRGPEMPEEFRKVCEEIDEKFEPPGGCFLLAADWGGGEAGGAMTVVGSAAFTRLSAEACEVKRFLVFRRFQRSGIGKVLLRALTDQARAAGYGVMRTEVPASVPALLGFYVKQGFREIAAYKMAAVEERVFLERAVDGGEV